MRWWRRLRWAALVVAVAGCGAAHRPGDGGSERVPADGPEEDAGLEGSLPPGDGGGEAGREGGVPEGFAWRPLGYPPGVRWFAGYRRALALPGGRAMFCPGGDRGAGYPGWIWGPRDEDWLDVPSLGFACPHGTILADGRTFWAGETLILGYKSGVGFYPGDRARGLGGDSYRRGLYVDLDRMRATEGPILTTPRSAVDTVVLSDGRWMLAGGVRPVLHGAGFDAEWLHEPLASVEVYDPASEQFEEVASMNQPRWGHRLVRLRDGRVLAIGGYREAAREPGRRTVQVDPLPTVEMWLPEQDRWVLVRSMSEARGWFHAGLLPSGRVLVVGGLGRGAQVLGSAEVYDPEADRWSAAEGPPEPVAGAGEVWLPSGRLLLAGGMVSAEAPDERTYYVGTTATQLYEEGVGWRLLAPLPDVTLMPAAVRLDDGRLLVGGGWGDDGLMPPEPPVVSTVPLE